MELKFIYVAEQLVLNPQRASLTLMYLQEGCSELVQGSPDDCSRDVPCPPFMLICSLFSLPEADVCVCVCVKRVCILKGGHREQESYSDRSGRSGGGEEKESRNQRAEVFLMSPELSCYRKRT